MTPKITKNTPYAIELTVGAAVESLPVVIRKHSRSKRMVIRYQPIRHQVSLTLPRYVTIRQGLHFVEEKRAWLERQIQQKNHHVPFTDGNTISVFGTEYTLRHTGGRGVITIEESSILVPGEIEFMERRVLEWLKKKARAEIDRLTQEYAARIGKKVKRISLRDTTSRWGSCSHDGSLSFSWRLIFAPYEVLDYVVCHEVAHLAHHDHSDRFWAVCASLCPDYHQYRNWLTAHGGTLYFYG